MINVVNQTKLYENGLINNLDLIIKFENRLEAVTILHINKEIIEELKIIKHETQIEANHKVEWTF